METDPVHAKFRLRAILPHRFARFLILKINQFSLGFGLPERQLVPCRQLRVYLSKTGPYTSWPGNEITPSFQAAIDVAAALSAVGARALVACRDRLKGELQAKSGIFFPVGKDMLL